MWEGPGCPTEAAMGELGLGRPARVCWTEEGKKGLPAKGTVSQGSMWGMAEVSGCLGGAEGETSGKQDGAWT